LCFAVGVKVNKKARMTEIYSVQAIKIVQWRDTFVLTKLIFMLRSLLIVLFLIFYTSIITSAQENTYFENNPVWQVSSICSAPYPCVLNETYNYYIGGDTVLNGLTYKMILKTGIGFYSYFGNPPVPPFCVGSYEYQNQSPEFFLRSLGKQMYVLACAGCEEELLYDFDLEVGETLPLSHNNWSEDITVLAIDSIYTPFGYRKRFEISGSQSWADYLIEGIGHSKGLVEPINIPLECGFDLNCFSLNDIAYYPEPGEGCMLTVDISETENSSVFSVYPNPFNERTTISFSNVIGVPVVKVYNLQGQQVQVRINAFNERIEIERSSLNSGLYIFELTDDTQILATGKLLIID